VMLHVFTCTLMLRYQCCGRAFGFLVQQPCTKGQYRYKEARIRTMAVSEPMGGGGPAKGLQLKNLKSHTVGLHTEATLYVVCLKSSVNGTRKQTKQKIQTN
jgi:hypothetical protein